MHESQNRPDRSFPGNDERRTGCGRQHAGGLFPRLGRFRRLRQAEPRSSEPGRYSGLSGASVQIGAGGIVAGATIVSQTDMEAMITAAGDADSAEAKRLTCIVEMLYAAGLRVSELAGLPLMTVKNRD